ncbi:uncharacterized protein J4E78_006826 [Alternaria triticimaculans]|uniref:uncharacterized protein n=1 Tax=Alternaria triticimaculans TaxID=297637 RepID=UPI0020C35C94|nr:uncharacterized protein J4E78_006826 [Alternaria triticimaculans]KAI4656935.1 hypothetical protein J4E78_006826 [Alternaria triticimaculans]
MDAALASFQARLATFGGAATTTKTRRTSSRSKKAGTKSKAGWPLASPAAQDLAYAGFVWRPTTASPDNVQCFSCECQLDGWEESDVPAYEHATHSPSCGFAVIACIRLRSGDPGRTEEDPTSDAMVAARRDTFGDMWPLDPNAGYPSVDQMVAAGWFYDPTDETPDGVTCAYCARALDAWDIGDDPMQEHRKRSPDCLFFTLSDIYNPPIPAPKKGKRASKAKGRSARSSTASTASKKATRGKKHIDDTTMEDSELSEMPQPAPKRGKKRTSDTMDITQVSEVIQPAPKRGKKRMSDTMDITDVSEAVPAPKRGKKRMSDAMEITEMSEVAQPAPKRVRSSSIESFPSDLPGGTPKKTPTHTQDHVASDFDMSSLPGDLMVGTPKRTPPPMSEADDNNGWEPANVDMLFASQGEAQGLMQDILIDAGLDNIEAAGSTPEQIFDAVMANLTDHEKSMTIEQWVLYNAKRGEEKLRMACERQIMAFEAEGQRAMTVLEAIPTI